MSKSTTDQLAKIARDLKSGNVTKASSHGPRFDSFPQQSKQGGHGAQFDTFTSRSQNPHGPLSDEGFRGNKGLDAPRFERALADVPKDVRQMPAGCPSCGHQHTLEDSLRAGQHRTTGKTRADASIDVRKSDDASLRPGVSAADDLQAALRANIRETWGDSVHGFRRGA